MTLAIDSVAEHIKPLEGAITRRYTCGSTVGAGMPVTLVADTFLDPSDTSDATLSFSKGIAVQGGAVGERIDVVVFGPVLCLDDATPGALVYASDTAGGVSHTAGTKTTILGQADTTTILFVNIKIVSLS